MDHKILNLKAEIESLQKQRDETYEQITEQIEKKEEELRETQIKIGEQTGKYTKIACYECCGTGRWEFDDKDLDEKCEECDGKGYLLAVAYNPEIPLTDEDFNDTYFGEMGM